MASSKSNESENGARRKVVRDDGAGASDDEPAGPSNEVAQLERLVPNRPPREAERKFSFPERGFANQPDGGEFSDSSDDDGDEEGAVGGADIVQARNPYPAGRGRNEERPPVSAERIFSRSASRKATPRLLFFSRFI